MLNELHATSNTHPLAPPPVLPFPLFSAVPGESSRKVGDIDERDTARVTISLPPRSPLLPTPPPMTAMLPSPLL